MARQLGIEIIVGSAQPLPKQYPNAPSPRQAASTVPTTPPSRDAAPKLAARPKGCQHGPIAVIVRPEHSNNQK